jgi:hypothetical protein
MDVRKHSPANQAMMARTLAAWSAMLNEVLVQDFHGNARIELLIANGTIQRITRTVERTEK